MLDRTGMLDIHILRLSGPAIKPVRHLFESCHVSSFGLFNDGLARFLKGLKLFTFAASSKNALER